MDKPRNGPAGPPIPIEPREIQLDGLTYVETVARILQKDSHGRPLLLRIVHDDGSVSLSAVQKCTRIYIRNDL